MTTAEILKNYIKALEMELKRLDIENAKAAKND